MMPCFLILNSVAIEKEETINLNGYQKITSIIRGKNGTKSNTRIPIWLNLIFSTEEETIEKGTAPPQI